MSNVDQQAASIQNVASTRLCTVIRTSCAVGDNSKVQPADLTCLRGRHPARTHLPLVHCASIRVLLNTSHGNASHIRASRSPVLQHSLRNTTFSTQHNVVLYAPLKMDQINN